MIIPRITFNVTENFPSRLLSIRIVNLRSLSLIIYAPSHVRTVRKVRLCIRQVRKNEMALTCW